MLKEGVTYPQYSVMVGILVVHICSVNLEVGGMGHVNVRVSFCTSRMLREAKKAAKTAFKHFKCNKNQDKSCDS